MQTRIFPALTVLVCLLGWFYCQSAASANKIITYVDEEGKKYYGSKVPPQDAKYGRSILNKRGRVVEKVERAKSREELEMERRLARLREDEQKIISNQKRYDAALLNTYHSKTELMLAIKAKREGFERQNQVIEGNLERLKQALETQQKHAATLERNGEKVPQKLLDEIKSTQKQIQEVGLAANEQKEKQEKINKADQADIARFLFLTQTTTDKKQRIRVPNIKEANALGLFYCENDHQCSKAWEIARTFVEYYSTTPADVYNEKLIMHRLPATDQDLSLSVSKLALSDEESQLFLDFHCRESSLGKELCQSQKVKDIRSSFIPFVNDALSRSAE